MGLKCYGLDGKESSNVACDPSVDGVNTHTTCCSPTDICTTSGICLSTQNNAVGELLWVDGCTDQTFKSKNCSSYCKNYYEEGPSYTNIWPCNATTWCCAAGGDGCCDTEVLRFSLEDGVGNVIRQLPSTSGSSTSSSLPTTGPNPTHTDCIGSGSDSGSGHEDSGMIAGVAVLGVALLATLVALAVTLLYVRKLRRAVYRTVGHSELPGMVLQGGAADKLDPHVAVHNPYSTAYELADRMGATELRG